MESTEPAVAKKLTWEEKKKDYMREYMRKRYKEKTELLKEQSRIRGKKYRSKISSLKNTITELKTEIEESTDVQNIKTKVAELLAII